MTLVAGRQSAGVGGHQSLRGTPGVEVIASDLTHRVGVIEAPVPTSALLSVAGAFNGATFFGHFYAAGSSRAGSST